MMKLGRLAAAVLALALLPFAICELFAPPVSSEDSYRKI